MSLHQDVTYAEAYRDLTRAPDRLWHDAVHEAGRIAISRVLGLPSVQFTTARDHGGQTAVHVFTSDVWRGPEWISRLQPERNKDDRAFWRGRIIVDIAGAEAEREIIGRYVDGHGYLERGFGYSDDGAEPLAGTRRFARQLVKRHRATILQFADQLMAAHELEELMASPRGAS